MPFVDWMVQPGTNAPLSNALLSNAGFRHSTHLIGSYASGAISLGEGRAGSDAGLLVMRIPSCSSSTTTGCLLCLFYAALALTLTPTSSLYR